MKKYTYICLTVFALIAFLSPERALAEMSEENRKDWAYIKSLSERVQVNYHCMLVWFTEENAAKDKGVANQEVSKIANRGSLAVTRFEQSQELLGNAVEEYVEKNYKSFADGRFSKNYVRAHIYSIVANFRTDTDKELLADQTNVKCLLSD